MQFSPTCVIRRSTQVNRPTADNKNGRRPSAKWFLRFSILLGVFFISTAIFAIKGQAAIQDEYQGASHGVGRSLLSADADNTSEDAGPAYERCDFEEAHLPYAWVVLYAICVLIFFIALAIICDDFFVPSLEVISEKLDLSEDVAGATFMAAGSSAPELFTAVVGVAWDSDVGVGTIVGSAVFNILIIIALTAALAGQVLHLDYRPLLRDSFFYGMSIACFIGFSWDGKITWWESLCLLILYFCYILLMKFNSNLMNLRCWARSSVDVEPLDEETCVTDVEPTKQDDETMQSSSTLGSFSNVGPPRHLPPLNQSGRKESSSTLGVPGADNSKHGFQHVKQGELSSKFTHSHVDLRKDLDNVSLGSRPRSGMRSRPMSAASIKQANNNNRANGHANGTVANPEYKRANSGTQSGTTQTSVKTTTDVELGDIESMGGDSNYGSQTRLVVPNSSGDLDSGIHSALGPTPVQTLDPSSTDSSDDPKKRHSDAHQDNGDMALVRDKNVNGDAIKEEDEGNNEDEEEPTLRPIPCLPAINMYYPEKDTLESTCGCLKYLLKWVLFIVSFPFVCMFTWTIPNCGNEKYRKWYIASFVLSVTWIAALSFGMVTLVIRAGCILKVDHYTMGLVVVAVGTSVPDALSSILVARDGFGDMAVSNAIGSNVFDINLGIGLPFIIKSAINHGAPVYLLNDEALALLNSGAMVITPHAKFGFLLLLVLFITLTIFTAVRFRLNKVVGITFVCLYFMFVAYAFIQEFVCDYDC